MKKVKFENRQGLDLVGYLYPNDSNSIAVIMMHGFGRNKDGPSGYYKELSKLISKKYTVLRFDFQACGESEGHFREFSIRNYLKDCDSAIEYLKSLNCNEFYLIGHSLGALVAIKSSIKHGDVKKVIAIAPPILVKLPQKEERIHFEKQHNLTLWETSKIIMRFLWDKLSIQPISILRKINTYTTIIFSYEDKLCDYKLLKPKIHDSFFIEWKEIKGADHSFSKKIHKQKLFKIIKDELKL